MNNILNELEINSDGIAILPSTGVMFQLNDMGKNIIELIKKGKNKKEIVDKIAEKYNEKWGKVYLDVEDFFLKLKILGLYHE